MSSLEKGGSIFVVDDALLKWPSTKASSIVYRLNKAVAIFIRASMPFVRPSRDGITTLFSFKLKAADL
jgi:hypothetical protein